MRHLLVLAALLCSLFATACMGPSYVSHEHRMRLRSASVTIPQPGKETIYMDRTTGVLAYGVGGAVGGLAAAINMAAGESRFSLITEPHRPAVSPVLAAKIEQALAKAGKPRGGDAFLTAENVRFGVSHLDDQIFAASVSGRFKLTLASGEKALDVLLTNSSGTHTFRREDAAANSRVYRAALEEAAEHLATDLASRITYGRSED